VMRWHGKTSPWLAGLLKRRPFNVAVVALANKLARIAWAVMARGEATASPKRPPSRHRGEATMSSPATLGISTSSRISACSLRQAACGGGGSGGPALPSAARGAPGKDRSGRRGGPGGRTRGYQKEEQDEQFRPVICLTTAPLSPSVCEGT
jgi:hypothetical protein